MAVYMIQCVYEDTRTWMVDAQNEEQARAFYDSGELEMNGEPAMHHSEGRLQSLVKMEGQMSKKMEGKVIELPIGWPTEQAAPDQQ